MRSIVRLAPLAALSLGLPTWLTTTACRAPDIRTESLGTFAIRGVLDENACSPGVDPVDPLAFSVELREFGGQPYWRNDGQAMIEGSLSNGIYRFATRTQVVAWEANPASGIAGCTLRQTETISFEATDAPDAGATTSDAEVGDAGLDAGAIADAALADAGEGGVRTVLHHVEGQNIIEIVPEPGSDCRPLLLHEGGSFPNFPCRIRYEIDGTRTGD